MMHHVGCLLLLLVPAFTGCKVITPPPPNRTAGNHVFGKTLGCYGILDGKVTVVVWFDVEEGETFVGMEGNAAKFHGTATAPEGKKVTWHCITTDGKSGTVRIQDKDYEMTQGPLFLVAERGGPPQVRQLQRSLSNLPQTSECVNGLAKSDPDIMRFIADAEKNGSR